MTLQIAREEVKDEMIYDIMYFSPVECGEERYQTTLYFQTEMYYKQWPVHKVELMKAQIDQLRHVELGIHPFDDDFRHRHKEMVISYNKMAFAYLDAREARLSMKLCEVCEPATRSTDRMIAKDPFLQFDFLRVVSLSMMACASRKQHQFEKAKDALFEAKDICMDVDDQIPSMHPLLCSLVLLNLSSVLGDMGQNEHALRWGLKSLKFLYQVLPSLEIPDTAKAYYLAFASHNAALLNVKLSQWNSAIEFVGRGIELTRRLDTASATWLREKLIVISAKAKHVPEAFMREAVNARNGWGNEPNGLPSNWNLSFWDFNLFEITEVIHVLQHTTTLKTLAVDRFSSWKTRSVDYVTLLKFVMAVTACESLETIEICGIEIDPRNVWHRQRKRSFLETSWYASAMNYTIGLDRQEVPGVANYAGLMKEHYDSSDERRGKMMQKLVTFLCILGNRSVGVDLSENNLDARCMRALVAALRCAERPPYAEEVHELMLRDNMLDQKAAEVLATIWLPELPPEMNDPNGNKEKRQKILQELQDDSDVDWTGSGSADASMLDTHWREELEAAKSNWAISNVEAGDNVGHDDDEALCGVEEEEDEVQERESSMISLNMQWGAKDSVAVLEPEQGRGVLLKPTPKISCTVLASHDMSYFSRVPSLDTLDVSNNEKIGDAGFRAICQGASHYTDFRVLVAKNVGLSSDPGLGIGEAVEFLGNVRLQLLSLADNNIGPLGCVAVCQAAAENLTRLHTLDLSSCNIGSDLDAAKAVSRLCGESPALEYLYLNNNDMGGESISIISDGIAKSRTLSIFHFTNNSISDKAAAEALGEALRKCTTMEEINMSGNEFTLDRVPAFTCLGSALEDSNVQRLQLENMGIDAEVLECFLQNGVAESTTLQGIVMDTNPLCDDGLHTVSECLSIGLTELSLSNCEITEKSEISLLHLVSLSPNLRVLNISKNKLGPTALNSTVEWMSAVEKENFALRSLEISGCEIGDEGLMALIPILGCLDYLGVRENGITSVGLEGVMKGNQMIQLIVLDLGDNEIGEGGVHALTERFQQEHKRSLWNPKQLTSTIDTVILSNNQISQSLAVSTECFLKVHNPLLHVIW